MSCYAFPDRPEWAKPRATTEHMPFKGHRTCAQWGPRLGRKESQALRKARDYGFDPESLKASAR